MSIPSDLIVTVAWSDVGTSNTVKLDGLAGTVRMVELEPCPSTSSGTVPKYSKPSLADIVVGGSTIVSLP
jgi:hypothetical protein